MKDFHDGFFLPIALPEFESGPVENSRKMAASRGIIL
jgi:hypothetical protein